MNDLFDLLHDGFGCPEIIRQRPHNPFNPAQTAWLAYDMLKASLEELEIDTIVENIRLPGSEDKPATH